MDLKFGLAEKFNKRRYLDNGVTPWYTTQSFRHKDSHFVTKRVIPSHHILTSNPKTYFTKVVLFCPLIKKMFLKV